MTSFADEHAMLCARELPQARRDAERLAEMVSALIESLCLVAAVGGQGEPDQINTLCEGISARLFEGAAEKAPLGAMLRSVA